MAIEIYMPALSPTMEEGTLATWLVKEGDAVSSGDVIAEIETDKATMEVESIDEGIVAKIFVDGGTDNVAVGTLIAILAEEGEDIGQIAQSSTGSESGAKPESKNSDPVTAKSNTSTEASQNPVSGSPDNQSVTGAAGGHDNRVKASPLARRLAEQKGLSLENITGSGPHGRIIKRDIDSASSAASETSRATNVKSEQIIPETSSGAQSAGTDSAAKPAASDFADPHADIPFSEQKLSNMRKTIARRLTESKTTVPHFYLTVDCDLTGLMSQRKELNLRLESEGLKISVNDFIIRAVALALKKVPAANVQFAGDKMYWYERADISVAVAIDGGLVTPVVRGADQKGLAQIARDMKDLASKARDGKLTPEEYAGGTFSISNLGMMGIKEFSAVINPPQGAILAIGAGEMRPVIREGAVSAALVMSVTLSCDHRAIDGAVGAEFLAAFKGFIEDPLTMLL